MLRRWTGWIAGPRALPRIFALSVGLCLPALGIGWLADDHMHRARILGSETLPPVDDPILDLFVFMDGVDAHNEQLIDVGILPWWAAPGLRATFLRPLTALTHQLDYALWPGSPWAMHLHSLGWLVLTLLAAAVAFRRLHGPGTVAILALALFALDDVRAIPVAWIANRNALIAVCFGLTTLVGHEAWRRRGWTAGLPLAMAAYTAGLLSGELAVVTLGYLLAFALFQDRGRPAARVVSLLPYGVVTGIWLIVHRVLGFGTYGSDVYVDPGSHPLGFARAVVERVPILLQSLFTELPMADIWPFVPGPGQIAWSVLAAALLAAAAWGLRRLWRERPLARFWALGTVVGLVPVCASFPMNRLLLFAAVGGAGLLAEAVSWSGWLDGGAADRRLVRWSVGCVLLLHLVLAPLLTPLQIGAFGMVFGVFDEVERQAPTDEALADQRLVLVNGVEFSGYIKLLRELDGEPGPRAVSWLGHLESDLEVIRTAPDALTIVPRRGFLATRGQQLCRSPRSFPFAAGDVVEVEELRVEIDEVTADGRPARATFRFPVDLEDPSLRWLVWREGRLLPFELPEVGRSVRVPPTMPRVTKGR